MLFKKTLIAFVLFSSSLVAQDQLDFNWQFGIGAGITRYSDTDALFIGDKTGSQIPRLHVTKKILDKVSVDGAISFGSFDASNITENTAPYFSFDLSGRYRYLYRYEKIDPYVFIGTSYIDATVEKGASFTANAGTGATYWLGKTFGVNGQVYYKHALNEEKIRSHIQVTFGIVFGLNGNGGSSRNGSTRCYYDQHR